jgi:hypothetical protein
MKSPTRFPIRWALLSAVAVTSVFALLNSAFAFDQQATDDAIDNAINLGAVQVGDYSGPYARSIHKGTIYLPRHRSYR